MTFRTVARFPAVTVRPAAVKLIDAATIEQLIAGASEFIPAPANLQPENELNVTPQAFDLLRQSVRALEFRVSALEKALRYDDRNNRNPSR